MLENIDTNYIDKDIKSINVNSYKECLEPCIRNLKCFSFNFINESCYLKSWDYRNSPKLESCKNNTYCNSYELSK